MLNEQITQPIWVSVKQETRQKLRSVFGILMTGNTDVINDEFGKGRILSDGCTNENLKAITAEKLQEFLGSVPVNTSLHDLFKMAVEKIELPEVKPQIDNTARITMLRGVINDAMKELDKLVRIDLQYLKQKEEMKLVDQLTVLLCDKCPYQTANKRALLAHKRFKHKEIKVA